MSSPPTMPAAFATLFGPQGSEPETAPLSHDAQKENLLAAWAHYSSPKQFAPGQIVKERKGLGVLKSEPVMLLLRYLDPDDEQDQAIIRCAHNQLRWCKVNCIVAWCDNTGQTMSQSMDSDTLEPFE